MSSLQLIHFDSVYKAYGPKIVLEDCSFTISRKERLALIGENGAGKTTIAKMVCGLIKPNRGVVHVGMHCKIGYLPQDILSLFNRDLSIYEFLKESYGHLNSLEAEMQLLEEEMATGETQDEHKKTMARWDELQQQLLQLNGYEFDQRVKDTLRSLSLDDLDLSRPLTSLSGGYRRRIGFAALLLQKKDLIVLDEPTNDLDSITLRRLEDFLLHFEGAVLFISHDRNFLNKIANGILEMNPTTHRVTFYSGNYDNYHDQKVKEIERGIEAFEKQRQTEKQLKQFLKEQTFSIKKAGTPKDNDKMSFDFKGENAVNAQRKNIQKAKNELDEIEANKLDSPLSKNYLGLHFNPKPLEHSLTLVVENVDIRVSHYLLKSDLSFTLHAKDRLILTSPNGTGKTTFLKMLLNHENPEKGKIQFASSVTIGYLSQEPEFDDENMTVLSYLKMRFNLPEHEIRSKLMETELIEDQFVKQAIHTLSLGKKRRLQLVELILSKANLLLLDEPTNHLAPFMIDELENALKHFSGSAIIVTHDERFAKVVGTKRLEW